MASEGKTTSSRQKPRVCGVKRGKKGEHRKAGSAGEDRARKSFKQPTSMYTGIGLFSN